MKKSVGICLFLTLLPLCFACAATGEYRNDVSVETLCDAVRAEWSGYLSDTSSIVKDHFPSDASVIEHAVLYRGETSSLDEIGFFRLKSGDPSALALQIQRDYLASSYDKNHTFYDSYMPNETPKLQNAEVRVYGNYVVYAILSEADKATLFRFVEEALRP